VVKTIGCGAERHEIDRLKLLARQDSGACNFGNDSYFLPENGINECALAIVAPSEYTNMRVRVFHKLTI